MAVDVQNISSNTKYYYRFYNVKTREVSVTGETLTLPSKTDAVSEVKMAVVSCSNFPAGLFNVYGAIAVSDADVVVHLGDYIYEYAPGQYGTNPYTSQLGRAHIPAKEILNLSDYRERYRQYRSDKNLQLLHQKKPFICVWDDHEFAKWKVLGQQILMIKMMVPAELLMLLNQILAEIKQHGSAQPATMQALQNTLAQLIILKTRYQQQDPTLTSQEIARITTKLPYNLDAWDGYFMEREQLYSILAGKDVVVLAGDTHNAWLGKLKDAQGNLIGTELACSSVSSPGIEGYLGITSDPAQAIELAQAFSLLIDDLEYANLYKRGYLYVKFTSGSSVAEWRFVDNVISETYNTNTEKTYTIS